MNNLELINNNFSLTEQKTHDKELIRNLQNTIFSGNIFSFKKITTLENDEGEIQHILQKYSEKEISHLINKSFIEESLNASGFKLHVSKNGSSILKIEKETELKDFIVPILQEGKKIAIMFSLYEYIKNDLNKDLYTDVFKIDEFKKFNIDMQKKTESFQFEIMKLLTGFIDKYDNLFIFNDIYIDYIEHLYLEVKKEYGES